MSDPVEFLRARLDEDEAVARAALPSDVRRRWFAGDEDADVPGIPGHREVYVYEAQDWPLMEALNGSLMERRAQVEHIARWDPARVLAEVEAKRRVLDLCAAIADTEIGRVGVESHDLAFGILDVLAQPYADHPDFDPMWSLS